jgi:hypothetical protein
MESETAAVETGVGVLGAAKVRKLKRATKGARRGPRFSKRAPRDARTRTDTTYRRNTPKVGMALTPEVARAVRRLRAQLEMKSGERVTIAKAIEHAVKAAMKK